MLIIKIIRFFAGTVRFKIFGTFPQRLLNLIKNGNIAIWEITPHKNTYSANTYAKNYKDICSLRKGTKAKLRVTEKHGIPFILFKLRKRYGLIMGIAFSALMLTFLTTRIWSINIGTDNAVLKEELKSQLNSIGINVGAAKNKIDAKKGRRKLMLLNKNLAWVGINIKGSVANIEISEKQSPPSKKNPLNKFADIIAERDGKIVYMEIKNGQPLISTGYTVSKGDVIVSGTMKDKHENIRCVYSDAVVLAECYIEISAAVPFEKKIPIPNGNAYRLLKVGIFNKELFLPSPNHKLLSVKSDEKTMFLPFFPKIYCREETFIPIKYEIVKLTEEEAREKAKLEADEKVAELKNCEIILEESEEILCDSHLIIKRLLTVKKDIAKSREF